MERMKDEKHTGQLDPITTYTLFGGSGFVTLEIKQRGRKVLSMRLDMEAVQQFYNDLFLSFMRMDEKEDSE